MLPLRGRMAYPLLRLSASHNARELEMERNMSTLAEIIVRQEGNVMAIGCPWNLG